VAAVAVSGDIERQFYYVREDRGGYQRKPVLSRRLSALSLNGSNRTSCERFDRIAFFITTKDTKVARRPDYEALRATFVSFVVIFGF